MVRTLILHTSKAFAIFALSLFASFVAFAGEMTGESVVGQVSGYRVTLPTPSDQLLSAKKISATLELTFQTAAEFSAEQVSVVTNGLQCTASSQRIRTLAEWNNEGGVPKLVLEMEPLRFGNQEPFLNKVIDVVLHHGSLTLDVRAPFALKTAKLIFTYELPPPPLPTVQLTKVVPAGSILYSRDLTLTFASPEGAKLFECRHWRDSHHWTSCTSPTTFTDLKNGRHHFAIRAIDKLGRVGHATRYRVYVDAPNPPVIFTSIVPKDNPTTSTTMQIAFEVSGTGGNYVECHLDNQAWAWCSSPVLFKNLVEGNHQAAFRRTNWIYNTIFGKWLGEFAWFQAIFPIYTEAVVYSWTVQRGIPSAELVSTPNELTKASLARFEFRSDVLAHFRSSVDGNAAAECVSPLEVSVNEGLHVFEVTPYVDSAFGKPVSFRWEVDQTAPELSLGTVVPAETNTSASTLSLGFTSSEGATFRCALDAAAATACETPVQVTGLRDGAHELSIVATDQAGNVSEALVYEWTVDRQAPGAKAQMTFPASVPTKLSRAVFSFLANESATFRCAVDGVDRGTCVSPFEVTDLAEGQHEFSVTPIDGVGNVGAGATIQWVVDMTLPLIQVMAVEPPDSATESHSIRIDFEVTEPASVLCELDGGGQLPCRSPYLASGLADGNHQVEIIAVDAAQNVSRAYRHPWRIDSVALVQITSITPDAAVVNSRSLTVEFGSSNAASFVCSLDGAPMVACASPVQFSDLEDGAHLFAVHGLNLSGSVGPAAEHLWTVDTAGPVVSLDSVHPAPSPTATKALTLTFSSVDAASFFCTLDAGPEAPCASPVSLAEMSDGAHKFSIVAVDTLGNRGNPTAYEWIVDTTGPTVAFGNMTPSGVVVASLSLTAELVSSEPVTFFCALDGGPESACVSPYTVDVAEGKHTLSLVGVDTLGNRGLPVSYQWGVLLPEAVASIDAFNPATSPTTSETASVTFSGTDAVGFVCKLDEAAFAACASGVAYSQLSEGSHSFSVAGINLSHRQGPVVSRTWFVDRTGPVVQILSTNPSVSPTAALSLTAYFSASETATFRCQLDAASETDCVAPLTVFVGEGDHQLAISGIDALGNRGAATLHQWTVSVPEAVVTLASVVPSALLTQNRSFTAGFIGTDAASFECRLDGGAFAACASPFLATSLVDGAHQFDVRGVNAVGRVGVAKTHNWTIDNVGPAVTSPSLAPATSPTASRQMTVAFAAEEAGATFSCALDGGAASACSSPVVFSGLADGSHQVVISAADSLGNAGTPVSQVWVVDATGPVTTFSSVVPAGATSLLTLTAAFTANETATFACSLDGSAEVPCSSPHLVTVGEGNHTIAVVGTDALGNRGAVLQHSWVVSVPDVFAQIDAFMPSQTPTASRTASVSFSGVGAASFRCSLDGAAFSACASPQNFPGLSDGAHSFAVVAVNSVGKVGSPVSRAWAVDTSGPVTHLESTSPAITPTASSTLTAAFSANESAEFRCSLDGASEVVCTSPHMVNVGQGAHTLSIAGVDGLGNRGAAVTYSWTVAIPAATVSISSTTPSVAVTNATAFSAVFAGVNAVSFECRIDSAAFAGCMSPYNVSGLVDGAHTFQVRGINAAGQVGVAASYSWTIDTVGPNATLVSVTPDWSPTSNNTLTASFSANEGGATFACRLDSGVEVVCASPYTFTGLVDGAHHISIAALDSLGNRGTAATYDWIVDSTALNISNVSVTNVTSNSARIEWSTNFVANSKVKYGTGANLNQTSPLNGSNVTTHSVVLTGLSSFTFYSAQAVSVDRDGRTVQSSVATFRTLRP